MNNQLLSKDEVKRQEEHMQCLQDFIARAAESVQKGKIKDAVTILAGIEVLLELNAPILAQERIDSFYESIELIKTEITNSDPSVMANLSLADHSEDDQNNNNTKEEESGDEDEGEESRRTFRM